MSCQNSKPVLVLKSKMKYLYLWKCRNGERDGNRGGLFSLAVLDNLVKIKVLGVVVLELLIVELIMQYHVIERKPLGQTDKLTDKAPEKILLLKNFRGQILEKTIIIF